MNWKIRLVLAALVLFVYHCNAADGDDPPSFSGEQKINHQIDKQLASGQEEIRSPAKPESTSSPASHLPTAILTPPNGETVTVHIEVARKPSERQRGLMYRKHLDQDRGMLFVFSRPRHLSFWMKNTYIPLDMIFIDPTMYVLGIVENTTPLSEQSCSVPGISQYVLEVNAGFSRHHRIAKGTRVSFSGVIL